MAQITVTTKQHATDNGWVFHGTPNGSDWWAEKRCAMEGKFVVEDVHNIGEHYDPTLMAWWQNFDAAWPHLEAKYGPAFYRMWKYYLLSCAATFRTRHTQLYQIVFTQPPTPQPPCRVS